MLGFTQITVFDPVSTILRGCIALVAVVAVAWVAGPVLGVVAVVAGCAWFVYLARVDHRRVGAVSLRLDSIDIEAVDVHNDGIHAVVRAHHGTVARLGRHMQRRFDRIIVPGVRRVPLFVVDDGWQCSWFEHGRHVGLTVEEARGATAVILDADDVRIELVIGGYVGEPARPLAVGVASRHGSLQSWDPVVNPVLARSPDPLGNWFVRTTQ